MNYTKQLAQFAAQLQYNDLPQAVIEKAKELALHSWGVQLAGSTLPWAKSAYRYATAEGRGGNSTIVNFGTRVTAADAAFVNGVFAHGFEIDDNHGSSSIKGGCVSVPAAFAIGEQQLSSGKDLILAIVIAYELMIRTSLSCAPVLMKRGYQATGTCGPFGAGAAAGKLLRFDETTMLHTLSIAASHSAGLMEAPAGGRGELKRIYGGMAAGSGIRAARLAAEGLTGPANMLEGEQGFCRAFGDSTNLPALTAGLGTDWHVMGVHYKIYAQDGFIQPMSEAMELLVKQHGFRADDVEEVRAGCSRHANELRVGEIREPKDLTSAQFSANFSLALLLVTGGAGLKEYTEENLRDPKIVALSKRIHTYVDEEVEREYLASKPRGCRITLKLKSGATHTTYIHNMRAMTPQDVDDKVRKMAAIAIESEQCERLIKTVRALETVRDVSALIPLLTR